MMQCTTVKKKTYIVIAHDVKKNTHVKLYLYLYISTSVYWISCCPIADKNFAEVASPTQKAEQVCSNLSSDRLSVASIRW